MPLLTQAMYGTEFNPASRLFGLRCGQMRSTSKVVHNGGWYNRRGEKLGWGDLSTTDFLNIQAELPELELLVVLEEEDSFWKFVTHNPGVIGSMCSTTPTIDAPGVGYVATHCSFIVSSTELYHIEDDSRTTGVFEYCNLKFKRLGRAQARNLMVSGTKLGAICETTY